MPKPWDVSWNLDDEVARLEDVPLNQIKPEEITLLFSKIESLQRQLAEAREEIAAKDAEMWRLKMALGIEHVVRSRGDR